MKQITLDTTIRQAIELLNEATSDLAGVKFNSYSQYHELILNKLRDITLPEGAVAQTWAIDYEKNYRDYHLFTYVKNVKEDARCSTYNPKGKILDVKFEVGNTWYDRNDSETKPLPEVSADLTIAQLIRSREIFFLKRSVESLADYIAQVDKEQEERRSRYTNSIQELARLEIEDKILNNQK